MPANESLASRVRAALTPMGRVEDKRMFVCVSEQPIRSPAAFDMWMRLAMDYNARAPRRGGKGA